MNASRAPILAIDATPLIGNPMTGIQRVIVELVPRLAQTAFSRKMGFSLVHSMGPRPYPMFAWNRRPADGEIEQALDDIRSRRAIWRERGRAPLSIRLLGYAFAQMCRLSRARSLIRGTKLGRVLEPHIRGFCADLLTRNSDIFEASDFLVSFAGGISPLRLPARIDPAHVLVTIHDLIPLWHDRYVDPAVSRGFGHNIANLAFPEGRCGGEIRYLAGTHAAADEIRALFQHFNQTTPTVRVVPWGFDRETFYPDPHPTLRRDLGLPDDAFLVLAVSNQEPRKRFAAIETAVRFLADERPVYGVFLGHGPQTNNGPIRFLGSVSDELLRRAYSTCDVFVNWSACEGFGLPVIEALACRAAAVVVPPDNPALMEVGGKSVTVADAPTVAGLVRTIEKLMATPVRQRRPVDLSRFDWDKTASAIVAELCGSEDESCRPTLRLRAA